MHAHAFRTYGEQKMLFHKWQNGARRSEANGFVLKVKAMDGEVGLTRLL